MADGDETAARGTGDGGPVATAVALTVATGAMDAISFLALGGVFTSVMTANLSLLGISAGAQDPGRARDSAVAVAGFIVGALLSARIVRGGRPVRRTRWALGVEVLALGGLWAGWATAGGHPGGGLRLGLLAVASLAMGGQSGLVRATGPPGMSTTYLTGTLTGLLVDMARDGRVRWVSVALLAALVAGAALGGLLVTHAAPVAPALPTVLVALVLLVSFVPPARGAQGSLWPHTGWPSR
ncbi:YoaK family protein [Streptomyces sp. NPDC021212]|uniref:YoaK family protein n=1 Tax=Streptomyces sp. NPDC021212 TaxID=3365118 RepID=UPI00379E2732